VLKAGKIAVAHTADDQAETVLMRLIRGSGMQGLAAIPPVRLADRLVRPLIYATRSEVENYLAEKKIESVTDPSNFKKIYLRNRIRLELIPALKAYNPRIIDALSRTAECLQADEEFLDIHARELMGQLTGFEHQPTGPWRRSTGIALDLDRFKELPEAMKRRVVRLAIAEITGSAWGVSYGHIIEAASDIPAGPTGRGINLPGGVRVERSYRQILIYLPEDAPPFNVPLPLPVDRASSRAEIPELGLLVEAEILSGDHSAAGRDASGTPEVENSAIFDFDKLAGPLAIRSRRPGDFFYPAGMEGKKKLKEYFIDLKLPRASRSRVPLLECGGEIAWVMGYRQDRRFAPGSETKKFIKIIF
ncbi:MAG: tRNA lysidine(34) synthetase TilS, partial [Nitrospirota bacterium]